MWPGDPQWPVRGSEPPTALAPCVPLAPSAPSPSTGSAQQCQDNQDTLTSAAERSSFYLKCLNIWKEPVSMFTQFNTWTVNKRWPENGISLESRELSALPLTYFSMSLEYNFQFIWLSATLFVFMLKRQFQYQVQFDPFGSDLYCFELLLFGSMQLDLGWTGFIWFYPVWSGWNTLPVYQFSL